MVNKCVAYGWSSGANISANEDPSSSETLASFRFPFKKEDLLRRWVSFVNRQDWTPKPTSVLCEKHFEEKLITRGKRCTLKWVLNPFPTKHSASALKRPSIFSELSAPRKPQKIRNIDPDQLPDFLEMDKIKSVFNIDIQKHCPSGYCASKRDSSIVFYMMDTDGSGFPFVSRCITIDENLHVKLQCNGRNLPLPK